MSGAMRCNLPFDDIATVQWLTTRSVEARETRVYVPDQLTFLHSHNSKTIADTPPSTIHVN